MILCCLKINFIVNFVFFSGDGLESFLLLTLPLPSPAYFIILIPFLRYVWFLRFLIRLFLFIEGFVRFYAGIDPSSLPFFWGGVSHRQF